MFVVSRLGAWPNLPFKRNWSQKWINTACVYLQSQYFKPSTAVYIRHIDKVQKKAIKVGETFLVSSHKLSFAATKETLSIDEKKKHFRMFGKFSSQVDSNQIEFHEPVSSPFIETEGKEW